MLIEEPLIAAQHEVGNRRHARACAGCFRFVGDVSTSIGERLLWKYGIVDEDARASTSTPLPSGLTVGDLVRLANGEARLPGTEAFDGQQPPRAREDAIETCTVQTRVRRLLGARTSR